MPGIRSRIGHAALAVSRYRLVGRPPEDPVYVVVAAPHTSNWDFPMMLAIAFASEIRPVWFGKRELFDSPAGPLLRRLGGLSVDRDNPEGVVAEIARMLRSHDRLALIVQPEGTRSRREYWKSGFLRMAEAAEVPIALAFTDRPSRTVGWGPVLPPGRSVAENMAEIRAFYADKHGLRPGRFTPPRLRSEDEPAPAEPAVADR